MIVDEQGLLRSIDGALRRHARLRRQLDGVRLRIEDGIIVVEGTVDDIAAKRRIPRIVVEAAGDSRVLDRLRMSSPVRRDDDELRQALRRALADEPVFRDYRILHGRAEDDGRLLPNVIDVDAASGVLHLSGTVGSLSHRRLAEVLAWWLPGSVDVENRLQISPAEQDSDDEITDALRLVLEKDPWIDAGHVQIRTRDRVVRLAGMLPGEEQKRMAENDAWYIPGVHGVTNEIVSADWLKLQAFADAASRASFPASDPPAMTTVVGVGGRAAREQKVQR